MSEGKKGFILYADILDNIETLSLEERGLLFTAILCDQSNRELPELTAPVNIAFAFIKQGIDRNTIKYNAICEKRREAGCKGGRPPKETKQNQTKPKETKQNQMKPNETNTKAKKPDNREQISDNGYQKTDNREQISDNGYQKTDNREQISEELSSVCRKPYGKSKNVYLSDEEYRELLKKAPEGLVTEKIEKYSYWLKKKNKNSYNAFDVLDRFVAEDMKSQETPESVKTAPEQLSKLREIEALYLQKVESEVT